MGEMTKISLFHWSIALLHPRMWKLYVRPSRNVYYPSLIIKQYDKLMVSWASPRASKSTWTLRGHDFGNYPPSTNSPQFPGT